MQDDKGFNANDYEVLTSIWEEQLRQKGWQRSWGENGMGWRSPDAPNDGGEMLDVYNAWAQATGTPTDLKLGIDKEPPAPTYHKPF